MLEREEIKHRIVIFLSVILSPMVYLVPAQVIDAMWPPPLHGLVFIFGSLSWSPYPYIVNPIHTRHLHEFTYLFLIWILVGVYLTLNFPHKSGKRITLFGHLAAFALQIVIPQFLFVDYTVVLIIPLPITPILSLLVLGMYLRKSEHSIGEL